MSESDNVVPFRRPRSQDANLRANEQGRTLRDDTLERQVGTRKPQPPARDIELSKRLAATKFLPPEQFLALVARLDATSRNAQLRNEANQLARVMASSHRVFVLTPAPPKDIESFYNQCYRLKIALDGLAAEFGRAALYNLGSFAVVFDPEHPSGWYRTERYEEQLRLGEEFSEQDVKGFIAPRLKHADVFEHEFFDVNHRNG